MKRDNRPLIVEHAQKHARVVVDPLAFVLLVIAWIGPCARVVVAGGGGGIDHQGTYAAEIAS